MKEQELQYIVEGTMSFFNGLDGELQISPPYPEQGDTPLLGLSGAIGISGARKGCIYVTADSEMLSDLCKAYAGVDPDEAALADMVGELANTVAGNTQEALGGDYNISVPLIVTGKAEKMQLQLQVPTFVIPFTWKNHKAYLVVGMQ